MGFIEQETAKIANAIRALPEESEKYARLSAAQQALVWARGPTNYASPYQMIMGIREDSKGYSVAPYPQ